MILYQVSHQKNIEQIKSVVPTLDYNQNTFGDEIIEFYVTSPMIQELNEYLPNYQLKNGSGVFRKPYSFIHFENFNSLDEWVAVYCIEPITFNIFNQIDINYVFDIDVDIQNFIANECSDTSKWINNTTINLLPGQILIYRPWLFHSFDEGLGHFFFMEQQNGITL